MCGCITYKSADVADFLNFICIVLIRIKAENDACNVLWPQVAIVRGFLNAAVIIALISSN